MKYCKSCGKEMKDKEIVCIECGMPQEKKTTIDEDRAQ